MSAYKQEYSSSSVLSADKFALENDDSVLLSEGAKDQMHQHQVRSSVSGLLVPSMRDHL